MRLYYRLIRFISRWILIIFYRGRVLGLHNVPRHDGVLIASTHQSFLDPVLVTLALDREGSFMARDTLFENTFFRRLIESLNAFPVTRGAADIGAVKEILRRLRNDRVVVVFPEATRTKTGSIGPINSNTLAIAKKARTTVVPTVIDGAFESWPRSRPLPFPGTIYVTYCEAITPAQLDEWSVEKITEMVEKRLHFALAQSRILRRRAARFADCLPIRPRNADGGWPPLRRPSP